jgi:uncharacterized repeat protein (TIGR01451 family)
VGASDDDLASGTDSVNITVEAAPPTADLGLTMTDSPDPVTSGLVVRYTITVTNDGPDDAHATTLTDTIPAGTTFVGAASDQGSCAFASGTVTCDLGTIVDGETVIATVDVRAPGAAGSITNTASVDATELDPNESNDAAAETTTVESSSDEDSAAGFATGNGPTTVQTAPDGLQISIITVPAGFVGPVTLTETPSCALPSAFIVVGECLELTAPSATAANPLVLKILVAKDTLPPTFRLPGATISHDGVTVPECVKPSKVVASPAPTCFAGAKNVRLLGVQYIQFLVYTANNGSWRPGFLLR